MKIMGFNRRMESEFDLDETSSGDIIEVNNKLFFAHCDANGWRRASCLLTGNSCSLTAT